MGIERPDDAGVYRLSDEIAIVQTVDFFTPIVDDARIFGRIAAANALSDVWTMGARPVTAMNIVGFPDAELPIATLREVLEGGLDALRDAGVALVGGHSISAPELVYGLSVTGTVHPERYLTVRGAREGDALVLTKALGTGIVMTGLKGGLADAESVEAATRSMVELNRRAGELMLAWEPHACTDVTGFGLIGHAFGMVECSAVGLRLSAGRIPVLPGAIELAGMGLLQAGLHRNRAYYAPHVRMGPDLPAHVSDLLHDPQTSGGLLIAFSRGDADAFVAACRAEGGSAVCIGEFVGRDAGVMCVDS